MIDKISSKTSRLLILLHWVSPDHILKWWDGPGQTKGVVGGGI